MGRAHDLWDGFKASLKGGEVMNEAEVGAAIAALFDAGQAAFPTVPVDEVAFARYLGERCASKDTPLPHPSLAADVYLACACVLGAPGAHAAFVGKFSRVITGAAARVVSSPPWVEDVRQSVLEALLCAPRSVKPKIAAYAGRAPLRAFLRTVALRTAYNQRRRWVDATPASLDVGQLPAPDDVEDDYVKARHKPDLEEALDAAAGCLSTRAREVLCMHLVDRLTRTAIGAHYGVARATAARWLARAREAWYEGVRAKLTRELGLTRSQCASLARLIRSRLDVSLASVLRRRGPRDPHSRP